jgi:hypothetical protein
MAIPACSKKAGDVLKLGVDSVTKGCYVPLAKGWSKVHNRTTSLEGWIVTCREDPRTKWDDRWRSQTPDIGLGGHIRHE